MGSKCDFHTELVYSSSAKQELQHGSVRSTEHFHFLICSLLSETVTYSSLILPVSLQSNFAVSASKGPFRWCGEASGLAPLLRWLVQISACPVAPGLFSIQATEKGRKNTQGRQI